MQIDISMFNQFNLLPDEVIKPMVSIPNIISVMPNKYFISSKGRIFYINRYGKLLESKLSEKPDGFLVVRIPDENNIVNNYRINKLVAYYFLLLITNAVNMEVFNADGNRHNNDWKNLRWCTHRTTYILSEALSNGFLIR